LLFEAYLEVTPILLVAWLPTTASSCGSSFFSGITWVITGDFRSEFGDFSPNGETRGEISSFRFDFGSL
jgi:hypothetical protein